MIRLEVPDAGRELAAVRLAAGLALGDDERAFRREGDTWVLELAGRRLHRLEYGLEVDGAEDEEDPPAGGEWRAPDYAEPWWLAPEREPVPGGLHPLRVRCRALRRIVDVQVWAPADAARDEALPLLLVHDGPETERLAAITRYAGVLIADAELPRCRVALLPPGRRDEWYSASTAYARGLCGEVLPAVAAAFPVRGRPVGTGASLGALAMLHAQRSHPHALGGLFLQSGSFFVPEHDEHESGFPRWRRITRFVRATLRAPVFAHPVPAVLTCGAEEENLENNRLMAAALARQGYGAPLVEVGDLHNYTAWRDTFDPHLTDLLVRVWEGR